MYFSTLLNAYYLLVSILSAKDTVENNLISNFVSSSFHH